MHLLVKEKLKSAAPFSGNKHKSAFIAQCDTTCFGIHFETEYSV